MGDIKFSVDRNEIWKILDRCVQIFGLCSSLFLAKKTLWNNWKMAYSPLINVTLLSKINCGVCILVESSIVDIKRSAELSPEINILMAKHQNIEWFICSLHVISLVIREVIECLIIIRNQWQEATIFRRHYVSRYQNWQYQQYHLLKRMLFVKHGFITLKTPL